MWVGQGPQAPPPLSDACSLSMAHQCWIPAPPTFRPRLTALATTFETFPQTPVPSAHPRLPLRLQGSSVTKLCVHTLRPSSRHHRPGLTFTSASHTTEKSIVPDTCLRTPLSSPPKPSPAKCTCLTCPSIPKHRRIPASATLICASKVIPSFRVPGPVQFQPGVGWG